MGLLQKLANWIKRPTPTWLKAILQEVQNIIVAVALQIGQAYISELEGKIIEAAGMNITSEQKFEFVFSWARKNLAFKKVKDSALNLLIEAFVSRLKENSFLKIG